MKAALGSSGHLASPRGGRHSNKSTFGSAVNLAQMDGRGSYASLPGLQQDLAATRIGAMG